ncbi:MAG TPA: PadR family transcriptional regulator [Acidimicrobiales bacterium]|nr:PadR family transcriptional regulator [Acidimicrobiales bacterium]
MPNVVELAILAHLATKPDHGYALMGLLGPYAPPSSGGLYRRLRSMTEDGLVASSWSTPQRGPARRVYSLTDAGRRHLASQVGPLDQFGQCIRGVLKLAREAPQWPGRASASRVAIRPTWRCPTARRGAGPATGLP